MRPGAFLDLLWQHKPENLYVLLWTLQDKRSHWFRDLGKAGTFASNANGHDVYVGVGLSRTDHGPSRRCTSDDIAGIAGLWADLDLRSDAHKKALPANIPDALSIIPATMPPTVVVATGNGAHAWWVFKEPHVFESSEERTKVAGVVGRWHTLLRLNSAARGWTYDRLSDFARVLRIPGTLNHKDPNNAKQVTIHSLTDQRYNMSDFEDFLDEVAIPDPEAQERASREWAERFEGKSVALNVNARIPEETLAQWMQADLRFRNTWLRQRHDLHDQSQSGYDLALACFGFDAGLPEQHIVDLIVHHRWLHNQRQRTRIDYYQRTLATAARCTEGVDPGGTLAAALAPAPSPQRLPAAGGQATATASNAMQPAQPDPVIAKAMLCERISQVLGVRILRMVKITGKEPTYQMELENATVEFPSVGKLIDQRSVRIAVASATNKLIPKIKPKLWEQLTQTLLDALIETDGGDETDFKGSIRMYINQYLTDTGFIETIENQPPHSLRCPTIIDGRIAICSSDLQPHVNKTFMQALSVKAIASMLAAIGAKNVQVKGKTFKPQSRWLLPLDEFASTDFTISAAKEDPRHAE